MSKLVVWIGSVFVLATCGVAFAQTVYMEGLEVARLVAPDYSQSTGGCGPSLSPDSGAIAYTDTKGEIWVCWDTSDSWRDIYYFKAYKLEFKSADCVASPPERSRGFGRNVDWSPGGGSLVFGYGDRLHIADGVCPGGSIPKVRRITEAKKDEKGRFLEGGPRWSPDGKKIAFIRRLQTDDVVANPGQIWVLDLETGTETMAADDITLHYGHSWGEPWSPDSKFLVYATEPRDANGKASGRRPDIVVVSADGKTRRIVSGTTGGSGPSFHPKLNKVVFNAPVKYAIDCPGWKSGYEGDFSVDKVWTVDADGKNRQLACPSLEPTKQQLQQAVRKANKIAASYILSNLKGNLTQQELRKLQSSGLALPEVSDIGSLAIARRIGGAYLKATEDMLAARKSGSAKYKQALAKHEEAKKSLSEEDRYLVHIYSSYVCTLAALEGLRPYSRMGSGAVWSPDGRRLAFIREMHPTQAVYCLDTKTGRVSPLIEMAVIDSAKWSTDGKRLLVQGKRLIASEQPKDIKQLYSPLYSPIRQVGYPEIWMLQPK